METADPKKPSKILPSNAYTKLEPGEEYKPIVPPEDRRAEVTPWSVTVGLIMVVVFTAACIYMAIRAANAIEAAIPIAIMAIFFGRKGLKPGGKSTILENVMVQSIGQAAGVVAAGAAFIIPAFYINQLKVEWWQIFLACSIGGFLGVVLIIPLRKYFVKDLHGDLPFPEATAINEILVSGESTSKSAGMVLLTAFGLGAAYDFVVEAVSAWNPMITTRTLFNGLGSRYDFVVDRIHGWFPTPGSPKHFGDLGDRISSIRLDLSMNGTAALFGLGYVIGLRYAAVIAAGSVFGCLVLGPLVYHFGSQIPDFVYAGNHYVIKNMDSDAIFGAFVKPIGIGAIAVSGVIGIIRMGKIVLGSISLGFKGLKGGKVEAAPRTQTDMTPRNVLLIQAGSTLLMALLFFVVAMNSPDAATGKTFTMGQSAWYAFVGAVVGFALSFLFTPVAAQAIAIVGVNPVSGMTLITVVLTILVLVATGLKGTGGMFITLVVGCAVCTALSTSGALISDFKIGYWTGTTPRNQEVWKFAGIIVASLVVAFVIPVMDSSYHFMVSDPATGQMVSNTKVLPAPQANMIAAVSRGLLEKPANQPWLLYGLGGFVAIMLYMAGVPMLAFALGIYIPINVNMAVLAGAFVAYLVGKTGGSEKVRKARGEQGVLIASGLMAGGAIFGGIIPAILRQPSLGMILARFGIVFPKLNAPIRHISIGQEFWLEHTKTGEAFLNSKTLSWYDGFRGQGIGLLMFLGLAVVCSLLAIMGARWYLREEEAAERESI
jgi:putative OPT family oligopeptide transporter